jgi:hypothetical protein
MRNYYEGWSEAELLALRKNLQNQAGTGQVLRASIAGVSVERAALSGGGSGPARDQILDRVQYSLWLIGEINLADPTQELTANPYENPYVTKVRRTRAAYV